MIETQAEQRDFEDAAFRAWMRKVDAALETLSGMTSAELPDYAYRDAHDGGEAPISTAVAVLEDLDFDAAE
jgi:hypothetical protein